MNFLSRILIFLSLSFDPIQQGESEGVLVSDGNRKCDGNDDKDEKREKEDEENMMRMQYFSSLSGFPINFQFVCSFNLCSVC